MTIYKLSVFSPFDGGYSYGYYKDEANAQYDGDRWSAELELYIRKHYKDKEGERDYIITRIEYVIQKLTLKG
jgi:hypothetical protein